MKIDLPGKSPGTYVLVLRLRREQRIEVGRLGRILFPAGYYLYVGSAFGPGGLRARINRHLKKEKARHWHIDYLREKSEVTQIWLTECGEREAECRWASLFAGFADSSVLPVKGFGSSDCGCVSHLIYFPEPPDLSVFERLAGVSVQGISLSAGVTG